MLNSRTIGIILLVVGFLGAVIAGLFFAIQSQSSTSITELLSNAGIAFIVILPFLIGGIYLYNRSAEPQVADSDVARQLRVLDYLRTRIGEVSIAELSDSLAWTEQDIRDAIQELIVLDLFSGYWDKEHDRICLIDTDSLQQLTTCGVCNQSLQLTYLPYQCVQCGTFYYSTVV